ncbi:MAG: arylamine N-acetyltransferase [Solirubrobacteraceae bacterium]|jgi:N-hydroxyarylamine O-acetyltransferase
MLDFDAYLERIGLRTGGAPAWQAIHRAHATSVPFENLDSHRGVPVSLEQEDLERKLVAQRRGGYCFEHNLLLASALEHLGMQVEPMLARVRVGGAPPQARPLSHLVLRVTDDDRAWHADVGFGLGTLLDPVPFGPAPDTVHHQSGWSFRVIEDAAELVLQTRGPDGWSDVYGFVPRPVPRIDIEVSNWWISTNPRSPFVSGLIVCVNHTDGRREAISDWGGALQVMTMTPDSVTSTEEPRSVIPDKLMQFGLPGFLLGDDERVRPLA